LFPFSHRLKKCPGPSGRASALGSRKVVTRYLGCRNAESGRRAGAPRPARKQRARCLLVGVLVVLHAAFVNGVSRGAAVLVAVLLALLGSSPARAAAAVVVVPATSLVDGQSVLVRAAGFVPSEKVYFTECATATSAGPGGCGRELAGQPFTLTDASGRAEVRFRVSASATDVVQTIGVDAANAPRHMCESACVLVATDGAAFASVPLRFRASLPFTGFPLRTVITASLAVILLGGALLTVGATGARRTGAATTT
jgi:hypothetical protein